MVDRVSVLGTHLAELIRRHAHELFSRQDAKKLLDRVAVENPKVVEDLVPKLLPLATVQRVLQNLLRERVSIRDAVTILEALGEAAGTTRNPVLLTEYVRQAMRRTVVKPYLSPNGDLPAFFVDPQIEQTGGSARWSTRSTAALSRCIRNAIRDIAEQGQRGRWALRNRRWSRSPVPARALFPAADGRGVAMERVLPCAQRNSRRAEGAFPGSDSVMPDANRPTADDVVEMTAEQREQLILEHLPQVRLIARRIHERLPEHINIDDLISAGTMGLISAVDNFDSSQNVLLKTYAEYRIRGAILDSLRGLDFAPRQKRRQARQIEAAMAACEQRLGRPPSEDEIADRTRV